MLDHGVLKFLSFLLCTAIGRSHKLQRPFVGVINK